MNGFVFNNGNVSSDGVFRGDFLKRINFYMKLLI